MQPAPVAVSDPDIEIRRVVEQDLDAVLAFSLRAWGTRLRVGP
jgi:hypothetical protein